MSDRPSAPIAVLDAIFRDDLAYFIKTDRRLALKIMKLVEDVMRDPFEGIGKPERLRHTAVSTWSRRIDQEHRLTYLVEEGRITFLQARFHYK